jgi:hypothetical protein
MELAEAPLSAIRAIAILPRPRGILSQAAKSSFRPFWRDARFDEWLTVDAV